MLLCLVHKAKDQRWTNPKDSCVFFLSSLSPAFGLPGDAGSSDALFCGVGGLDQDLISFGQHG